MSRAFRIFLVAFAAAMTAVAIGSYLHKGFGTRWWLIGSTACSYLVLASAYLFCRERNEAPTSKWLAVVFALALSHPIGSYESPDVFPFQNVLHFIGITIVPLCAYLGVTAFMLVSLRPKASEDSRRVRRSILPLSLLVGIGLVLSSLFLRITLGEDSGDTGWKVISRQANWITAQANVAHGAFFGSTIDWLDAIYAHAGYPIYILSLVATIATFIGLMVSRFSIKRLQSSSIFFVSAALTMLASLWVIVDIFWGWHFDLSEVPWAATVATGLWIAAPLFGMILLLPIARGERDVWRLRALLIFQLPLVSFNVLMVPVYFESNGLVNLPGLGCLILGLLIQSWACTDLLAHREKRVDEKAPANITAMAA